jgi:lysozyme family protein
MIERLIDEVIGREGGFSNHPADRGGATRWGVTEAVARANGYRGDMRDLPRDKAVAVYRSLYWAKPGLDLIADIAPKIAAELFDTGVNMGPATGCGFLRRALNALNRNGRDYSDLPATGLVDMALADALRSYIARRGRLGEDVLLRAIEGLQAERYLRIAEKRPAHEAFVYGWLANRVGQPA